MASSSMLARAVIYRELLRHLRDALKESPDALELAERLVKVYGERGPRGVREEIAKLVNEVLSGAVEAEEA